MTNSMEHGARLNSGVVLTGTYFASMMWAFGGGFWSILGASIVGYIFAHMAARQLEKPSGSEIPEASKLRNIPPSDVIPPNTEPDVVPAGNDGLEAFDRIITRAAALADDQTTVLALFRFRKERERLLCQTFDDDLAHEIDTIVKDHFRNLVDDYCEGRKLASLEVGERADRTLTEAVSRLTKKLIEVSTTQNNRHIEELEKTGNYLRGRHPVADDDPFSVTPEQ